MFEILLKIKIRNDLFTFNQTNVYFRVLERIVFRFDQNWLFYQPKMSIPL